MTTSTSTIPLDDKKRKLRNLLFLSFGFLIIIWIFKFTHPQFSVIPSTSLSSTSPNPSTTTTIPTSKPKSQQWHHATKPISKTTPPRPHAPDLKTGILPSTFSNLTLVPSGNAALLLAPKFTTSLLPLLLHFSSILGPAWPILLYTTPAAIPHLTSSRALTRAISLQLLEIRLLPTTTPPISLTNPDSINTFMTNPWLWEGLAPAENILVFGVDSMICANSAHSVEDYEGYSMVGGAPPATTTNSGGRGSADRVVNPNVDNNPNAKAKTKGGLTLRRRSHMLRVLERWDYAQAKMEGVEGERSEERWFYNRLKELQEEEEENGGEEGEGVMLPSEEVARTFSASGMEYAHPLGVNHVSWFDREALRKLAEWCPEYRLCL